MKRFFTLVFLLCSIFFITNSVNAQTADFEDLSLNAESYWNGSDETGGFFSGEIAFNNNYVYDPNYPSWGGFAYSNKTDTLPDGFVAQYNAITGSGVNGSEIYAIGYYDAYNAIYPTITLDEEQVVSGAYFTNNNYAYYSMTNGDGFAKKFTEADWFKVTITGFDTNGTETSTVEFKLADGTDIVNTWTWVDLNGLGAVKKLTFDFSSTDSSDWGINTPVYFCMDNFNDRDNSDDDNDGYTENEGDCNDSDASIHPGAAEICEDGIDQDCDGDDETCLPNPIDDDDDNTCFINSINFSFTSR